MSFNDVINDLQSGVDALSGATNTQQNTGFLPKAIPAADGNGLPFTKIQKNHAGKIVRNIIHWFIPEFGVVKMYVNPESMVIKDEKLITEDRTKGGYTLQYWGEKLTTISLSGTTGTSGYEGINVLHEIYRAEQYAFDAVGLSLAASNTAADLASKAVGSIGNAIGGDLGAGILGGLLGVDSPNNNALSVKSINSLAQLAFGVEMYYNGLVYRGFFKDMSVTEKANDFLVQYNINFIATQRRGYRVNQFAWQKSPNNINGYSNYDDIYSYDPNNIDK